MELRGRRRCTDCDTRWSYFETGSVECPSCGALRSVAVDTAPTMHTDSPAELALDEARGMLGERPLREVAEAARAAAAAYVGGRGFVDAGELLPLDDIVVAAAELRFVADHVRRAHAVDDATEAHLLALLAGAEAGDRPAEVPPPLEAARGLAVATVVEAYRRDVARWLPDDPEPAVAGVLESLRAHGRRIEALDGEVSPSTAAALLAAARDLWMYLREDDEGALHAAEDRLERLG